MHARNRKQKGEDNTSSDRGHSYNYNKNSFDILIIFHYARLPVGIIYIISRHLVWYQLNKDGSTFPVCKYKPNSSILKDDAPPPPENIKKETREMEKCDNFHFSLIS